MQQSVRIAESADVDQGTGTTVPRKLGDLDGGRHPPLRHEELGQAVQTRVGDLGHTDVRLVTAAGVSERIASTTQQPEQ